MPRRLIALFLTAYAILFAFVAVTIVRWPSIVMVINATLDEGTPSLGFHNITWRELGILYGAPCLLGALCFYVSAALLVQRRHGAFSWYLLACVAGLPVVYLVHFDTAWWQNPSAAQGALAGAGLIACLTGWAVWELRVRTVRPEKPKKEEKPRPLGPPSAAIMRQRMSFAQHGAKMTKTGPKRRVKFVW